MLSLLNCQSKVTLSRHLILVSLSYGDCIGIQVNQNFHELADTNLFSSSFCFLLVWSPCLLYIAAYICKLYPTVSANKLTSYFWLGYWKWGYPQMPFIRWNDHCNYVNIHILYAYCINHFTREVCLFSCGKYFTTFSCWQTFRRSMIDWLLWNEKKTHTKKNQNKTYTHTHTHERQKNFNYKMHQVLKFWSFWSWSLMTLRISGEDKKM